MSKHNRTDCNATGDADAVRTPRSTIVFLEEERADGARRGHPEHADGVDARGSTEDGIDALDELFSVTTRLRSLPTAWVVPTITPEEPA